MRPPSQQRARREPYRGLALHRSRTRTSLRDRMRLPNAAHEAHPWVIAQIVSDFRLLDVWGLPAQGGRDEFAALLEIMASLDPAQG